MPKINIGIYNGKTITEINILFFFKLTVNAAAMEPMRLKVGVPMARLMNNTRAVCPSIPRINEIKGATKIIGTLDINQCDRTFA